MKVGSLVRLKAQFKHEEGWHPLAGVLLMLTTRQGALHGGSRCLVQGTDGKQTKPVLEALEIIKEPKKVKKD